MPRIALLKITTISSSWDGDSFEISKIIQSWTEVTDKELQSLRKWLNYYDYLLVEECSNEETQFTIEACIKKAHEAELKEEEEKRKREEKTKKIRETREKKEIEKKKVLLAKLKEELEND